MKNKVKLTGNINNKLAAVQSGEYRKEKSRAVRLKTNKKVSKFNKYDIVYDSEVKVVEVKSGNQVKTYTEY